MLETLGIILGPSKAPTRQQNDSEHHAERTAQIEYTKSGLPSRNYSPEEVWAHPLETKHFGAAVHTTAPVGNPESCMPGELNPLGTH